MVITSECLPTAAPSVALIHQLRDEIQNHVADERRRREALRCLDDLQAAYSIPTRIDCFVQLVGVLEEHIKVLSFLLVPLLDCMMQ